MEREYRIIILLVLLVVSLSVINNNLPGAKAPATSVFSSSKSEKQNAPSYIQITGDICNPGIYNIVANKMTIGDIIMAHASSLGDITFKDATARTSVKNGSSIQIKKEAAGYTAIITSIPTAERLLLGIPLEINLMTVDDFDHIPGIGPSMAKRIIQYRQYNGGTMKVSDLLNVEGIGEKRYNLIQSYF